MFTKKYISYLQSKLGTLIIENTGQVVAHFRFIPKLEDRAICKVIMNIIDIVIH